MALSAGDKFGSFQFERALGRGGMGEVYLARDTRLDRHVAVKALPEHLAADSDRLARFQREAKVLASLNHSGIGAIYGLEESAGRQYLILEFVEGQTFADRIDGPIPVPEALGIAKRIAEALEAAREGRDPSRPEARQRDGHTRRRGQGARLRAARTQESPGRVFTSRRTRRPFSPRRGCIRRPSPAAIMGSPGYMSPEQAAGRTWTAPDIFGVRCVLYEMLSGVQGLQARMSRPPSRPSSMSIPIGRLPSDTPARIRELLETA
jgi:serine/threonine protein kinase